ncbi:MAG: NUDIX domain-containing protein [Bacillota bacterium]|uniref:NUDIX domain-containing protein n=1 Tax=Desulfurispora thermophila TaxID=265470 RepID=UPI00037041BB|nr:NUDIX hydrolase [Desulfurispora thermophila]
MRELQEKTISSRTVYQGKIFNVRQDQVELPGGKTASREVVEYSGAVAVVPLTGDGKVVMVRQYRYAVQEVLLEIPAGKCNPREDALDCAVRELSEETGLQAGRWDRLCTFYTTPGFTTEKLTVFLARELTFGQAHPDEDELVQVEVVPLEEALRMIEQGQIKDGKSIVGLLAAVRQMGNE